MVKTHKERLAEIHEAYTKAYDNLISILKEDIDKDDDGNIKLNDDKIKSYADGISKSSSTIDDLKTKLKSIELEQKEIEENENLQNSTSNTEEKIVTKQNNSEHGMNQHLE